MKVVLEKSVVKQIGKINEPLKSRIVNALTKLSKEPIEGDVKKMQNQIGNFRLRVGDYRILFRQTQAEIVVTNIASRGQVYK